MAHKKATMLSALRISVAFSCALALAEQGTAGAADVGAATAVSGPIKAATPAPGKGFNDYSALFNLYPDTDLEYWAHEIPWPEEIKKLGSLWPDVPAEKNAIYYFVKADRDLIARCRTSLPEPPGSASDDRPYAGDAVRYCQMLCMRISARASSSQAA
jgi:hypothetical protein